MRPSVRLFFANSGNEELFTMAETRESRQLLEALARWVGASCPDCLEPLCDHGVLCAVALGLKDLPRCLNCATKGLGRDLVATKNHLARWLAGKDCYLRAWAKADSARCKSPCLLSGLLQEAEIPAEAELAFERTDEEKNDAPMLVHDFGDMGCGDLVLELRQKLRGVAPGAVVRVIATDPGAPEDIPAWLRMVGHILLKAAPPIYDLRKRLDP